ncbi:PREDICTED: F-box protein At5g10340-like [Camelina sativa]|uniref:F-box protein At5g10340-like n=1 Tax=Camelina sativa TaxID=90675 RepID=A0ABM0Y430_CAMSA|nr:PREDICTED: F-box protein At5g10340-like [Camelina sativa]
MGTETETTSMEELLIPHDVIEHNHIMKRLDVKTLKSVSKHWRSTTPSFQERHHRGQSRDPLVLFVSLSDPSVRHPDPSFEAMRTLVVQSSLSVQIPTPWEDKSYDVCSTSCDGLICLYHFYELPSIVVNPTTRWHRTIPRCNYQLVAAENEERDEWVEVPYPSPGFGKDKISGTYKHVWLYNSAELGLNDEATTCEVFDFGATNAWRYLAPASPHLIFHSQAPVYVDGSLHWFTASSQEGETMVLSLDLHTETFQVVTKAPFLHVSNEFKIVMCNLKGRLCVSEEKWPNQVIWSLDDSDHKTWKKVYSIDLTITSSLFPRHMKALAPLAVLDEDKLLFYDRETRVALVTHDPKTKSYEFAYTSKLGAYGGVCYFPSLVSIL